MLIFQSFYLSYHALNTAQNESYNKALLNFAYFVNVLAILSESFPVAVVVMERADQRHQTSSKRR